MNDFTKFTKGKRFDENLVNTPGEIVLETKRAYETCMHSDSKLVQTDLWKVKKKCKRLLLKKQSFVPLMFRKLKLWVVFFGVIPYCAIYCAIYCANYSAS